MILLFSGNITPKTKRVAKKIVNTRLLDKDSGNEQAGGSNEIQKVWIDLEAQVPQTRAATARATQTQVNDIGSTQSDEEGHGNMSEWSLLQMTPAGLESDSEEVPQDEGAAQSLIAPSIYDMDPQNYRWGIEGMEAIYRWGLELKG